MAKTTRHLMHLTHRLSRREMMCMWFGQMMRMYFIKRSTNGGASFGITINLSNDNNPSFLPQIAVVGKNVYIVWVGAESAGESAIVL